MEEKTKSPLKWLKTYWVYIVIYVLFLYISFTSPRSGDDWEISGWYRDGFISTSFAMVRAFTYLNGRIANNIFDSFFAYYEFFWKIISPLVFTSIIFLSGILFNYHKKIFPTIVNLIIVLSVSNNIRKETFVWLVGNVSYIFVIPFILLYFNILFNKFEPLLMKTFNNKALNLVLVGFLAFFVGIWIENITLGFLSINLLILLYWLVLRTKPSKYLYSGLAGSLLSCLVLFSTPERSETLKVSFSGLFRRVLSNFPGVIDNVVVQNQVIYLIFIVVFLSLLYSKRNSNKRKVFTVISLIYALFMMSVILLRQLLLLLTENWYVNAVNAYTRVNSLFFDVSRPFSLIFCSLLIVFIFIVLVTSGQKEKSLAIYILGVASAGFMIISPYLGARTFSLFIILLGAIIAYLASEIKTCTEDIWRIAKVALILFTIVQIEKHLYWGRYTNRIENIRLQAIEEFRSGVNNGTIDDSDWLILPAFDTDAVMGNANPGPYDFHMQPFKEYHNLPLTTNVVFDDGFGVKNLKAEQVDGLLYKLEITPLNDISDYTYTFIVESIDGVIYQSNILNENYNYFKFPGSGIYSINCLLQNDYGEKYVRLRDVVIK